MDESILFNGVLRSLLGGRRRRSHRALRYLTGGTGSFWTNPTTLLTAAGVAWGIYETMQSGTANAGQANSGQWGGGSAQPSPATAPNAAPLPSGAPAPALPSPGANVSP